MIIKKSLLHRLLGICETKKLKDPGCWQYSKSKGKVEIEWARVPELQNPCGTIRLEGRGLPERLLVIYSLDGQFHAYRNRYTRMRKRLDPVPGSATIRCGGLRGFNFDYSGNVMTGPAKGPLKTYRVETNKCKLIIWLG